MRPLLIVILALAAGTSAHAQDTAIIIVTGQGLAPPPGTAAYASVVIDRDRLTGDASGRIEDVLRDVAGFQQFRRTDSRAANPTSQGVTLRALGGNASSRALVLLDGVPQDDPFAGYIPFSAIAPERLASARITRGGGAGAFGAGAVAGTIELESAGANQLPLAGGRGSYGSRNSSELDAGIAPRLGDGFVTVDGRWDRGDGYVLTPVDQRGPVDVPARYDSWSAGLRAVTPLGPERELQTRALVFDDRRLRGQAGTDSDNSGTDASVRFVARGRWGVDLLGYLQARDFRSGFVSTAPDRSSETPSLDQFKTPSLGAGGKFELRPPTGRDNVLRLGVDTRYTDGRTNERFRYVGTGFTRYRRAGGTNRTTGLFAEEDLKLGRLTLTEGARADHWSIASGSLIEHDLASGAITQDARFADRDGWRGSYRAGALYAPGAALSLRAAGYTGFRVPTLNELYRPFRVGADATAANPALGLERLRGVEGGVDLHPLPATSLSLTGFYNELQGAIANVTLGHGPGVFQQVGFVATGGRFSQRENVDMIEVSGLEFGAKARLGVVRLQASYTLTDARVHASSIAAALNGHRPAQSPINQASATAAFEPVRGPTLSSTLRYTGPQNDDDLGVRRLPHALTLDAVATLPLCRGTRLIGRAENLADERVVSGISASGVEDLGTPRTLWIGLSFALGR